MRHPPTSTLPGAFLLATLFVACSTGRPSSVDGVGAAEATAASPPTYHKDVELILQNHCIKCHHDGGIAPFPLTTYEEARAMAPAMTAATGARAMPPWGAQDTAECAPRLPWNGDERLTDAEIATLAAWDAIGGPEGDLKDGPPIIAVPSFDLPSPTFELTPRAPYTPNVFDLDATDEYRCFVLDTPALEDGAFVSAIQVVPRQPQIVHHATVFADIGGLAAAKAGPDGSFDCPPGTLQEGTGNGLPQLATLVEWAPGAKPLILPSGVAIELPPSSRVVMEVHYSTASAPAAEDLTKVQVRLASEPPDYVVRSWGIGNAAAPLPNGDGLVPDPLEDPAVAEFRIPANDPHHVEVMQGTYGTSWGDDEPTPIFAYRPHAHLAGVELKVDVLRAADGKDDCMLQSQWDFHWQRVYSYASPIEQMPTVQAGDRLRLRCTYDNTMANKRLGPVLRDEGLVPTDVFLGNTTLSEMCFVEILTLKKRVDAAN